MQESWRWFGPCDQVSVEDAVQAGARSIVTALDHLPTGAAWPRSEIARRQEMIRAGSGPIMSSMKWVVVESLPVSEEIKRQTGNWREHVENFKISLKNIAASGINVVCYNFMPLLDWTRTDLGYKLDTGATCMRFDFIDFVMFDIFVLKRKGAAADYSDSIYASAEHRFETTHDEFKLRLVNNITCGLPGAADHFSLAEIKEQLEAYEQFDQEKLTKNLTDFLELVAPCAQESGLRLCCHPDDPPIPLLGLPRVMSTEADYQRLIDSVNIPANGITFCAGSLGARSDNDLPGMIDRLGDRIHFLHLRNIRREHDGVFGTFHESEHLDGNIDMAKLVSAVLCEEQRRRHAGRVDHSIPFRPDHGQDILDDQDRNAQPGYPAIGRLKGLAELRGMIKGICHATEAISETGDPQSRIS